jgi:hypothetical protein
MTTQPKWPEEALDVTPADNPNELEELLAECFRSTKTFASTFFPDLCTRPFSKIIHDPIFDVLDAEDRKTSALAAPRGTGKTTLVNTVYPIKRIVFQSSKYIVPVSATGTSAVEQSENIKAELLNNPMLTTVFGALKPEDRSDPFGQKEWVTKTGIKVSPRGAGQQIRGRQYRGARPDLFLVDDLEDDEAVESEERREKLRKWFFSALMNSVDLGSDDWRVLVIGTILSESSLLNELIDQELRPEWHGIRLELFDDAYKSNWPEHVSDEGIEKLVTEHRRAGMLDVLYREFRNIPISLEDQGFKQEYFKLYERTEEEINHDRGYETVILTDPARTMAKGSAMTAIVGVSVNTSTGEILVREVLEDRLSPHDHIREMFDMAERLNAFVLAPEVTGLNEYVLYPIRDEMLKRQKHYAIIEVKPREGKTGPKRSGGLIPLYRRGLIYHSKQADLKVSKYLLQWPRPKYWDVIDCVSGIIFVLDSGSRFFGTGNDEWDSLDEGERAAAIEAEYDELDEELALEFDTVI